MSDDDSKIARVRDALARHEAGYTWVAPDRFAIEALLVAHDALYQRQEFLKQQLSRALPSMD